MADNEPQDAEELADLMGCEPAAVDIQPEDSYPLVEFVKQPKEPLGPNATQFERELEELRTDMSGSDDDDNEPITQHDPALATQVETILEAWELEGAQVGFVLGLASTDGDGYAELGTRLVVATGMLHRTEQGWALAEPDADVARTSFTVPPLLDDIGLNEEGELMAICGPLVYKVAHLGSPASA